MSRRKFKDFRLLSTANQGSSYRGSCGPWSGFAGDSKSTSTDRLSLRFFERHCECCSAAKTDDDPALPTSPTEWPPELRVSLATHKAPRRFVRIHCGGRRRTTSHR